MNSITDSIGWAQRSWNAITGCTRKCWYCYAKRMACRLRGRYGYSHENPFEPTFHPKRLNEPFALKKPTLIFVCSMGEIFDGAKVWISKVLDVVKKCPQHTFLFLTKKPENYSLWQFPKNCWLGTTVTGTNDVFRIDLLCKNTPAKSLRFVSFEPLIDYPLAGSKRIFSHSFDWAIVGIMTGPKKVIPSKTVVRRLVNVIVSNKIPLYVKKNVHRYYPSLSYYQEFPVWREDR